MGSARGSTGGKTASGSRGGGQGSTARPSKLDARGVEELLASASDSEEPVCIVTGTEEALRRLLMERVRRQSAGRDVTVVNVSARDATALSAVDQAVAPTLFGGATWLFVTDLEQGSDEIIASLKIALGSAGPDLRIVIGHAGTARGRGVITAAEKSGARVMQARPIAPSALATVLISYARHCGSALTGDAAGAIVEIIGPDDLPALLSTVEQLASDGSEGLIGVDLVRDTLVDAGTDNQFQIADLVWRRQSGQALAAFRHLVERNGASSACVTVVAALSYSLRTLARFVADRPTGSPWQVASALGVPAWKVEVLASQSRLWRPSELATATVALASADADAKGGLGDAGALDAEQKLFTVERLILDLAGR